MADITMCDGKGCPANIKNQCYRYKATPYIDRGQSWFVVAPYVDGICKEFWQMKEEKKK